MDSIASGALLLALVASLIAAGAACLDAWRGESRNLSLVEKAQLLAAVLFTFSSAILLKALAVRTKAGELAPAVLAELLPELSAASADASAKDLAHSLAWLKTQPAELHPMLKTLVARTQAGESLRLVLAELLPEAGTALTPPDGKRPESSSSWLDTLPAWRRWLLRWLLPSGVTRPH